MMQTPSRWKSIPGASLFALLLLLAILLPVHAINLNFLSQQAPARNFTDDDWSILQQAVSHALEQLPDGEKHSWNNPETPSSGVIEVLKTFDKQGQTCRQVRFINWHAELSGRSEFVYCKQASGEWKIAP